MLLIGTFCVRAQDNDSTNTGRSKNTQTTASSIPKKTTYLSVYYGVSNYLGDLGGNSGIGKKFIYDNNLKKRTSFMGVSFSYIRKEAIGLRLGYTFGQVAGADQDVQFTSITDNAYYRFKRNLDFQTSIKEWSLMFEVYPLKFLSTSKKMHHWSVQPYLLAGFGHYKFNPQGSYYDEISADYVWVDLNPLMTEGQGMKEYPDRKPYKLSQWNMPYGIGVQYAIGNRTLIGFEFVGRKLFTDYLDDVSTNFVNPSLFANYLDQEDAEIAMAMSNKSNLIEPNHPYDIGNERGNPNANDFYYSFNLKLSIQLNRRKDRVRTYHPPQQTKHKEDKNTWYKYDNNEICQ